ncbi:MAG: hypothetical protein PWQ91_1322 [Eubacteriales bacterium]|nr:hypothetical protein [Eubacteriales bacterium]MDN5364260.1 hypothetical protein [Eubacteriales bacterium]
MKELKIRVEPWRPETEQEVQKLLADGWEIQEIAVEEHHSCHDSLSTGARTMIYTLVKDE